MRLHTLELTGFGPFRETQRVDFDAFGDDGVFLISGRTGAGKSSILDGVSFALYGTVPRYDGGERRLRSDHSALTDLTEVRLEFTIGDTRWRVTRSPEYDRPAKRGGGLTTEIARAVLEEQVDGVWVGRAAKPRDVGVALGEMLGLGAQQFQQVILLAQNKFSRFLLAPGDERQTLLRALFGTRRFEQYRDDLEQRRREAQKTLAGATTQTETLLDLAERMVEEQTRSAAGGGEASGAGAGRALGGAEVGAGGGGGSGADSGAEADVDSGSDVGSGADSGAYGGSVDPGAGDLSARRAALIVAVSRADYRIEQAAAVLANAEGAHRDALAEHGALVERDKQGRERAAVRTRLAELEARAPERAVERERLERARAAEALRAPIDAVERADTQRRAAEDAAAGALAEWTASGGEASIDIAARIDELTAELARWEDAGALERPRILPPRELGGEFVDPSGDVDGCLAARRRPLRQRASCRVLGRTTLRVGALDGVDGRTQRLGGAGALEALTLDGALGRSCLELGEPRAHGRALTPLLVALDERAVLGESVAVRPLGVREHGGGLLDAVVGAADRDDQRRAARRQIARTRVHAAAIGTGVRPASNVGARVHVSLGTRVRTASTTTTSTHLGAAQRTPSPRTRRLAPAGRTPRLLLDHPLGEVEERLGLRRGAGEGLLRLAAALLEVVAVLLEPSGAEEGAQQRLPLVAGRQEEPRELVLREQDHLLELLRPEPEHLAEGDADIARLRGAPDPHPVDLLLEHGARDLGGEPATALGRPVVLGRPRHAPPRVADRELEPHLGQVGERAVVAAQPPLTAVVARHRAVQREADPVEDARLAGAGAPRDEEHPVVAEGVEIDALSLAERAEPGELERVQSHATASARTRSSSTSRRMSASCSLTPSPGRTWPRNASTSSASLRAARTRCA